MNRPDYRIVFYYDTRYNINRYVITSGKFTEAIQMQNYLNSQDFAKNVSRYYVVGAQFVQDNGNGSLRIKATCLDLGKREYWEKLSQYAV